MWTRNLRKGEHPLNICEGTERMTYFLIWVKLQKQHIYVHSSTCNLVLNALSHNFLWTIVFQNMHLSFLKKNKIFYVYDKCLCWCGAFTLWMSEVFLTVSFSVQSCWFLPLLHPRLGSISLILLLFLWTISCPMSLLSTEKTNVPIIP